MKILYLSQAGVVGGAERVLLDLIATIHANQPLWQCMVVAPAVGALTDEAHALGIDRRIVPFPRSLASLGDADGAVASAASLLSRWRALGRLGLSSPAIMGYVRELARTIAEFQPDIIHANGFKMHLLGARAASSTSPLLWHLHDFIGSRPLIRPLMRMHRGRCAMVVANSRSVADDARSELGEGLPIKTIYNGLDLERFTPNGPTVDLDAIASLETANGGIIRVGLIATAARWKGHAVFLRALAMLQSNPAVRGYVIGGPIYQTSGSQYTIAELRAMAANLGLTGKVGFTGHLDDIPAAMRSLDIVVHASVKPEPFGLVVVEAMASGCAVIASASGGVTELVENGSNALTHQPGDALGLARAIERLTAAPALRKQLGLAGRLTVEQRFDRKRMGAEFASLYDSLTRRQLEGARATAASP